MILKGYIFSLLYGVLCLALAHVMYKLGVKKIYTRKTVHILIGFEWAILYHFHGARIHFVAVCLIFLALLSFSYFTKTMSMLSSDTENSAGTVYFCVSMTLMATVSIFVENAILSFGVAVFCTSFGDGLAGVIGQTIKSHNPRVFMDKTLFGILANFIASFTSAFVFASVFEFHHKFAYSFSMATTAVVAEVFAKKGLDNITLPLSVFIISLFTLKAPNSYEYILPILLTPLIVAVALKKKWLTLSGVICAIALDVAVSVAFGNFGFMYVLAFLVGGTLLDKLKSRDEHRLKDSAERVPRTFYQVFANAFAPAVCAVLYSVFNSKMFLVAFCASIAEAFADTAASSLGAFSKNTYDLYRFKRCDKGLSGGVSVFGTLAALVFSFVMSFSAYVFAPISIKDALVVFLTAFIGTFVDSFLGTVAQVKYVCKTCCRVTDDKICCGESARRIYSAPFFNNELVNLLSSTVTALICCAMIILS